LGLVCKWKARRGPEANTMKKTIVLQLALQFNFWVALDNCNSPYLYIVSVIKQVAIVATVVIHRIYSATHYNFVTTTPFQLLCNFPMITIIMSCWHHFSSINQNLTHGTMKIFHDCFWKNIDIHRPLWLFILDGFGLWHGAKVATWHINWILETNIYMYLGRLVHSHR
jgi:hypothetical protein